MDLTLALVIATVAIALFFDYTNGFHDAANAIATSVSTRALTPRLALTMAAILNFVGALLGVGVAKTIKDILTGFDDMSANHALTVVLSALVGAIVWNLITWYFGIPSSSSHALIGGLIGVGIAAGVTVDWDKVDREGRHPDGREPGARLLRRVHHHADDHVDVPASQPAHAQPRIPAVADRVGCGAVARSRPAGCAEDHGRHRARPDRRRRAHRRRHPAVGHHRGGQCDLARHDVRRHAHHAHDGPSHHRPRPAARIRRRVDRRDRPVRHGDRRSGPGLDDAHHDLGGHGRRSDEAVQRRTVGRRPRHHHRVDHHDPRGRSCRRA